MQNTNLKDLSKIKIKAYIALTLSVCSLIPFLGKIFAITYYIVMFFVIKDVSSQSQSPTLLKNFSIFLGLMVAGIILGWLSTLVMGASVLSALSGAVASAGFGYYLFKALTFAVAIGGVVYGYFYYKELSILSDIKLFVIAYIFVFIDKAFTTLWLGWISWVFLLIAFVIELIAWIKLEHINKAEIQN